MRIHSGHCQRYFRLFTLCRRAGFASCGSRMSSSKLAILTDPQHTPAAVAHALLEAGIEPVAETW